MAIGVTNGAWGAAPVRRSAWDIGGQAGRDVGTAVGSVFNMLKAEDTETEAKENKARVQELMAAYSDPQSSVFAGMKGSARAKRLAQLLAPYDADMAREYEVIARDELRIEQDAANKQFESKQRMAEKEEKAKLDAEEKQKKLELSEREFVPGSDQFIDKQLKQMDAYLRQAQIATGTEEKDRLTGLANGLRDIIATSPYGASMLGITKKEAGATVPAPSDVKTDLQVEKDVYGVGGLMTPMGGEPTVEKAPVEQSADERKKAEFASVEEAIEAMVDSNENGVIDNSSKAARLLSVLEARYKGDADVVGLRSLFNNKIAKAAAERMASDGAIGRQIQANAEKAKLSDRLAANGPLLQSYEDLQSNSKSAGDIANSMIAVLRKESGAAIGAEEYVSRVKAALPDDVYKQMESELTGISATFLGIVGKPELIDQNQERVLRKYMARVPREKLVKLTRSLIPDDVFEAHQERKKVDKTDKETEQKKGQAKELSWN